MEEISLKTEGTGEGGIWVPVAIRRIDQVFQRTFSSPRARRVKRVCGGECARACGDGAGWGGASDLPSVPASPGSRQGDGGGGDGHLWAFPFSGVARPGGRTVGASVSPGDPGLPSLEAKPAGSLLGRRGPAARPGPRSGAQRTRGCGLPSHRQARRAGTGWRRVRSELGSL